MRFPCRTCCRLCLGKRTFRSGIASGTNEGQIYRCYVVYGRRWVVVLPSSILWLAGFACAIAETYYSSTASQPTGLVGAAKIEPFLNAFIVCCVTLNVITTGESFIPLKLTTMI